MSKAAAWYISFSQLHVPAAAFSDDPAAQIAGVRFIRLLLSRKAAPVKEVIEANVLGRIAALLGTEGNPNLLFECAWALTNVAASEYTQNVVDLGVIPMLGALLASRRASQTCGSSACGASATSRAIALRCATRSLRRPAPLKTCCATFSTPRRSRCSAPRRGRSQTCAAESRTRRGKVVMYVRPSVTRGRYSTYRPLLHRAVMPALAHLLTYEDEEVLARMHARRSHSSLTAPSRRSGL